MLRSRQRKGATTTTTTSKQRQHARPQLDGALLYHLVRQGNATAVRTILLSSSDDAGKISAGFDDVGNSCLHLAAKEGNVSCLRVLLSFGAMANVQNDVGLTPLLFAWSSWADVPTESLLRSSALIQVESIIELLLQNGADPTISGHETGETALHLAARYGQIKLVGRLLQFRGRPDQRSKGKDGLTPLELARKDNSPEHQECVKIMSRWNPAKEEWNPDQLARGKKHVHTRVEWSGGKKSGGSNSRTKTNISSASFKRQQNYLANMSAAQPTKVGSTVDMFNPQKRLGALRRPNSPEYKLSDKVKPSVQTRKRCVVVKQKKKQPIINERFGFDKSFMESMSSTWSPPKTYHPVTR